MKLGKAKTRSGVKYNIAEYEDSDVLLLVQDPTKLTRLTDVLNMYLGNKTVSVEASDDLSEKIEHAGFARKMQTVTADGQSVEVPAPEHDTNGKFIDAAIAALVAGSWRPANFTLPSGDDKHKETAALAFLQTLAETCGNSELNGSKCYMPSLEKTTRTGTGGLLPKWAMDTATQILNAGLATKSRAKH